MDTSTVLRVMGRAALIGLLFLGPTACGGGGSAAPAGEATRTYVGTQSPGDVWSWSLASGGTFTADNETRGYHYEGDYAALPSHFLKLTVRVSSEPGMTTPAVAYAFEVPDSALVVKPAGSSDDVIVAVSVGDCPGGPSLDLIWSELTRAGFDAATDSAYGAAAVAVTGGVWDLTTQTWLLDGTPAGGDVLPGLVCSGGLVTDASEPDALIALASTGVFVRDGGPGQGGAMGMRRPASPIDLADLVAAGREFRGFHYQDGSGPSAQSTPVWARPNGTGGLTGGEYDDVETDDEWSGTNATIAFGAQASAGIVNATLTDAAGTNDIVFLINRLGGRYFLFGISVHTHDGTPYSFIAIETTP